jgi:hypothetical protein
MGAPAAGFWVSIPPEGRFLDCFRELVFYDIVYKLIFKIFWWILAWDVNAEMFEEFIYNFILSNCTPWPGPCLVIIMDNVEIYWNEVDSILLRFY